MAKKRPKSPFLGRWHIASMTGWDEDYINEEVQAFIEFGKRCSAGRMASMSKPAGTRG
jgi:hypothetical protein